MLPSSIALNGAAQNSTTTLNTLTAAPITASNRPAQNTQRFNGTLLCLLPAALLFFWKTRPIPRRIVCILLLAAATLLTLNGCGSGGSINPPDKLLRTPPGTYQYQVTATSTTGTKVVQTVTLNLTVQ